MRLIENALLRGGGEGSVGRSLGAASTGGRAGSPGALHYVASKGGIIGFIRRLAREIGPPSVTINGIASGLIRTHGTSQGVHDEMNLFETSIGVQAIKRTASPRI